MSLSELKDPRLGYTAWHSVILWDIRIVVGTSDVGSELREIGFKGMDTTGDDTEASEYSRERKTHLEKCGWAYIGKSGCSRPTASLTPLEGSMGEVGE